MSSPDSASVKVTCNCSISHLENLPYSQIKEKMVKTYPLPPHWQPPNPSRLLGILHYFLFTTLCLCAYGQLNLESLWATIKLDSREGNPKAWREGQHRMSNQLNNVLVVVWLHSLIVCSIIRLIFLKAGLLLATSAVFITTEPPDTSKLDYTRRGPYLCIYIAFGLLIGAIIVTSVWILVTEKITSSRTEDVRRRFLRQFTEAHLKNICTGSLREHPPSVLHAYSCSVPVRDHLDCNAPPSLR